MFRPVWRRGVALAFVLMFLGVSGLTAALYLLGRKPPPRDPPGGDEAG